MSDDQPEVGADVVDIDPGHFRSVLAHLPTGVTVITARGEDGSLLGMAANSVTAVSLDPPLILFCPAKSSTTWPSIRAASGFCVNVMAGHHEEVTRRFSARGVDRFAGLEHTERPTGPALADAVAWIECRPQDEHDAGDHTIVVARVVAIEAAGVSDAEALVFFRGSYGSFRPNADEG
ncbi:MAG TPA: flavin reductase family protein [Solirubrobacterales bacterium]|jgi:flavin reductase (DIM6/NTAB) family NADH-FMN oxidoreductase RutF|nr:flavin reductase family protein [Solirubrobacterales bacterium]